MSQIVFINKGNVVTDSLVVAETFGKDHKHVLRDIEQMDCSDDFRESNFGLSSYKSVQNKELPKIIMTQDGFSFLVMGYTGKEAARFKEMYIAEFNRMRKELNKAPQTQLEILQASIAHLVNIEREQAEQSKRLEVVEKKIDTQNEILALNSINWREDATSLLNRTAQEMGGFEHIRFLRQESYEQLEKRLGVSLSIRLTNKRRRMADEGVCKSKRDKQSKLDVIADDKKLIEGYVAIVKELALRHGEIQAGEAGGAL